MTKNVVKIKSMNPKFQKSNVKKSLLNPGKNFCHLDSNNTFVYLFLLGSQLKHSLCFRLILIDDLEQ